MNIATRGGNISTAENLINGRVSTSIFEVGQKGFLHEWSVFTRSKLCLVDLKKRCFHFVSGGAFNTIIQNTRD